MAPPPAPRDADVVQCEVREVGPRRRDAKDAIPRVAPGTQVTRDGMPSSYTCVADFVLSCGRSHRNINNIIINNNIILHETTDHVGLARGAADGAAAER